MNPFKEAKRRLQWFDSTSEKRSTTKTRLQRTSWDAEDRVFQMVRSHSLAHSTLENIRIPDPSTKRGKKEVDVVLVTNRAIVLIEVKNWKGKIEKYEDGNGESDIFQADRNPKPVLSLMGGKCEVLSAWQLLDSPTSRGEVFPLIVLANKGNQQKISSMTSVCSLHGNRIDQRGIAQGNRYSLRVWKPPETHHTERMAQMLQSFGTWDSIHFDGGQGVETSREYHKGGIDPMLSQ